MPYFPLEQVFAFLRVVEDEAGGHDGDLRRTAGDVLGAAHADLVAAGVEPELLAGRPDRARNSELVSQFHLPLQGERRGTENQHGTILEQTRDQGTCYERERLANAHLVSQEQSCLAVGFPVIEESRDERALPGLEPLAATVDRGLGQRCGGQIPCFRVAETNLDALGDTLDFLDDGVGQRPGVCPQRREFFLYPRDSFR